MSGGAGGFGAGMGPAGFDPIADPTPARDVTPPRAILFQLNGFDFPLDDAGRYQDIHPTDQWVALQVGIVLGTVSTSPTVGSALRSITHVGAPSTQREAQDAIRVALATKVNAGSVKIESIDYEAKSFGGFKIALRYQNLDAQAEKARLLNVAV
jgi:hypothetical protein